MKAIIVIVAIIIVIAVILLVPVRVRIYAKFENSKFVTEYKIRYGFINIKTRKKKKSKKKRETERKEPEDKKTSPLTLFRFIKDNIELLKRLIRDITQYTVKKLVRFEKFKIIAILGTDDAMDTALSYGSASAFLYNTVGFMERKIKMKGIEIDFRPDFAEPKIFIEIESIIRTKLYNVIGLACLGLRRAMPLIRKRGEINNGKSH